MNEPSTTVRRKRDRQSFDAAALDRILAEGYVAHVGFVRDGHPVVLPFLVTAADIGDGRGRQLLLHGSTGGGIFLDGGGDGVAVAAAITHLDGLVFARSLFDSSANYRSAVVFGTATVVPTEHRRAALAAIGDHLMPGRRDEVRDMTDKEIAQTQVLRVPLDRVSVKIRFAGAGESPDDGEDHGVWAGVLPLALGAGEPLTSAGTAPGTPEPLSVTRTAAALERRAIRDRDDLHRKLGVTTQPIAG